MTKLSYFNPKDKFETKFHDIRSLKQFYDECSMSALEILGW